jgi:hypothetical protein
VKINNGDVTMKMMTMDGSSAKNLCGDVDVGKGIKQHAMGPI